jgi:hypothetical protein
MVDGEEEFTVNYSQALCFGLFGIGWLMENKSSQSIIPKLCAFASLSIWQTSPNAAHF